MSVTISAVAPNDFELIAHWLSKAEINQWLTAEWRGKIATSSLIAIAVRNRRNRMFLVRDAGQPCGLVGLADLDLVDRAAMVWYFLGATELSGRGITSKALLQLVRLSFDELGIESLYAWIMKDNAASGRVLKRAHFREAGCIRRSASSPAGQVDRIYFDIVRHDLSA